MKFHHYFAVGLKIFSVVLFVYGLKYFPNVIEAFKYGTLAGVTVSEKFFLINLIVIWLTAIILWTFPVVLAKMFLRSQLDLPVEPIGTPMVMAVFIAAIGLYFFVNGIIDLSYWAIYWHMFNNTLSVEPNIDSKANTIATILQLLVSLLLILKCRTVSSYINKVAQ